jgi:hypothetical protein
MPHEKPTADLSWCDLRWSRHGLPSVSSCVNRTETVETNGPSQSPPFITGDDSDFVDDFHHAGKVGHRFLGELLLVEARQSASEAKHASIKLAGDRPHGGVRALPQTLPCPLRHVVIQCRFHRCFPLDCLKACLTRGIAPSVPRSAIAAVQHRRIYGTPEKIELYALAAMGLRDHQ